MHVSERDSQDFATGARSVIVISYVKTAFGEVVSQVHIQMNMKSRNIQLM